MTDKPDSLGSQVKSKIKTNKEMPVFSDAQLQVMNSNYIDSLDEALAVLDEDNVITIGQTKAFINKDE